MREEILIKNLQNGDASALDELISMYYQEILRYCIWHAPDRTQAEDAAQETFLKAVKYLGNFGFSGKFRAFLYKIAANTCIDMQKNKWNSIPRWKTYRKNRPMWKKILKTWRKSL